MSSISQSLSLFIPRVFANITEERIANVFESLGFGQVRRVDRVTKLGRDGKAFYSVYIHFDYWNETVTVANFQERVRNPRKEARVVYDEPWYWIVLENTAAKQVVEPAPAPAARPLPLPMPQLRRDTNDNSYYASPFTLAPLAPAVSECFDFVDATYAAHCEEALREERLRAEELEQVVEELKIRLQEERAVTDLLDSEVNMLHEELGRKFQPVEDCYSEISDDDELDVGF
jgi:hypothetical protein